MEYLEKFWSENVNKIHKGLKEGSEGVEFENYAKRINSVRGIEISGSYLRKNKVSLDFL